MDDFTKAILAKANAREEATKKKMLDHSYQPRSRPGPLNSRGNVLPSDTSRPSADATGDAKKPVSDRLKRIAAQRKMWEAEERGEDINFSEMMTPRRHEEPDSKTPQKVALSKKSKLAALSSKYKSLDDDEDLFASVKEDRDHSANDDMDCAAATEDSASENTNKSENVESSLSSSQEETTLRQQQLQPSKVETSNKRKSDAYQPVPTKRKSLGVDKIITTGVSSSSEFVSTSTPQAHHHGDHRHDSDATVSSSSTRHMIALQDHSSFEKSSSIATTRRPESGSSLQEQTSVSSTANRSYGESDFDDDEDSVQPNTDPSSAYKDDETTSSMRGGMDGSYVTDLNQQRHKDDDHTTAADITTDTAEASLNLTEAAGDVDDDDVDEDGGEAFEFSDDEQNDDDDDDEVSIRNTGDDDVDCPFVDSIADDDDEAEEGKKDKDVEMLMEGQGGEGENYDSVIDDLFTFQNESICSSSVLNVDDVTFNKSRRQICDELQDRRQVCNEAEDRHTILQRRVSRREMLSPVQRNKSKLLRSNSTESLLSLTTSTTTREQQTPQQQQQQQKQAANNFPVFTIDAYRSEKRKSTSKASRQANSSKQQAVAKKQAQNANFKLQVKKPYKEKLNEIVESIQRQNSIIKQASDAVNCCYDVKHGKGSVTELEAEKLLLIASKTRLALVDELTSLKNLGRDAYERRHNSASGGEQPCKAALTISKMALPMRSEYLFSMGSKKVGGDAQFQYYVVLVKTGGGKVLSTELVSTLASLNADQLEFTNKFHIENLTSNFEVTVEIYTSNLRDRGDGLSQDRSGKGKFSVFNKKATSATLRSLTPRKFRSRNTSSSTSSSLAYCSPSPGGPNAIRTSSFTLIGSCTITKNDTNHHTFELSNVPFLSPIAGKLKCKISTDFHSVVEQRGFLTMFDDVGGLGAWHRRWCALYNGVISAWEYPNDETLMKHPQRQISLAECISKEVGPVARINCARPNVFEFRTMRERRKDDKDNLITCKTGSVITIKHWLAADSKEERDEWIVAMNQSLRDVREWYPDALMPL